MIEQKKERTVIIRYRQELVEEGDAMSCVHGIIMWEREGSVGTNLIQVFLTDFSLPYL